MPFKACADVIPTIPSIFMYLKTTFANKTCIRRVLIITL